jgi:predicted metalloendopeptidase
VISKRDLLFEEWWTAEARSRYFAALAGHFSRNHQIITFASLVFSSGAVGAILADPNIRDLFGLSSASRRDQRQSALSLVRQYSKRAIDCSELYLKWAKIAGECRDLWGEMYEESAPGRLKALLEKGPEILKVSPALWVITGV